MVVRQSEGIVPLLGTWVSVIAVDMHNRPLSPREMLHFVAHTQEKKRSMEAKLYVGNLPFSAGDADLQTLFAQAGTVKSAQVIKDRASGRSKGFGFVEMASNDEASEAMSKLNGKEIEGRSLSISVAREKENRGNNNRW